MRTQFLLLSFPVALLACSGDKASGTDTGGGVGPVDQTWDGCDPLDPSMCLLPFPSRYFLEEDGSLRPCPRTSMACR